jgi:hypothetical protein
MESKEELERLEKEIHEKLAMAELEEEYKQMKPWEGRAFKIGDFVEELWYLKSVRVEGEKLYLSGYKNTNLLNSITWEMFAEDNIKHYDLWLSLNCYTPVEVSKEDFEKSLPKWSIERFINKENKISCPEKDRE